MTVAIASVCALGWCALRTPRCTPILAPVALAALMLAMC